MPLCSLNSITPVTLISGVGLMLLCMTARYNHTTDRVRQLLKRREDGDYEKEPDLDFEIHLIFRRSRYLRRTMLSLVLSDVCSGLIVATNVAAHLSNLNFVTLSSIWLAFALALIVASSIYFQSGSSPFASCSGNSHRSFARQNERARPLRRRHVLTITEFNDSLSLALAPITLISGVGLLMICMTNRYNHATNRIRQLMAKREGNIDNSIIRSVIDTEIDLLYMRASLLRRGMLSVALSAFFSAILVAVSVSARFLDLDIHILESCILVAAVLLIVLSALLFAGEINVSLKALKLAVDKVPRHGKWSLED